MSKAFQREDGGEAPLVVPTRAPLPAGVPNYVTPRGLAALRQELRELEAERARLGAAGDGDGDTRSRLATVTAQAAALGARIASAELVDPAAQPADEVHLGATVRVRTERGDERTYRIVGVDEASVEHGDIAFVAPLARALLGKQVGDGATVRTPRGDEELEVVAIDYLD